MKFINIFLKKEKILKKTGINPREYGTT